MDFLSCPFCGCDAVELCSSKHCLGHGDYINVISVVCNFCGCSGPPADDYDRVSMEDMTSLAVHRWNQRLYEK